MTTPIADKLSGFVAPVVALGVTALLYTNHQAVLALIGVDSASGDTESFGRLTLTFVWLSAAWLIGRLLNMLMVGPYIHRKTGRPAPRIVANTVGAIVLALSLFGIVKFVYGRGIGGLLATSGVLTLVIGFAIREMIADYFSGIAINVELPYQIGDWVEVEPGVVGRVVEVNWRATRLITQSHRTVIIPNNDLASRQFINYSKPTHVFRERLEVILSYTTDANRAQNILHAAVLATEGLAPDRRHDVRIDGFDERGVVYAVRFWIDDYAMRANLRHRVAKNILQHLNQAGITIPVGQSEVFLTKRRSGRRERRIDPRRLLSRVDWLDMLTRSEQDQLALAVVSQEYAAGEIIVREGDQGDSLYLLVEGTLEATAVTDAGAQASVGKVEPGEAFGEMSFLTGEPRAATLKAMTDAFVLKVAGSDFEPILRARPQIADQLGRIMAERQDRTRQRTDISEESLEDVSGRAAAIARRISAFFGLNRP